jgi:type I restriction enzyme, S subunit
MSKDEQRRRVALGEALKQVVEAHGVKAAESYPNLGIWSFGRGPFKKPNISGTATSARTLYRVRQGQFIYSRLFAFEGAYGLVSKVFDGHYVSNEYPVFDIDASLVVPEYLALYFRWPEAWRQLARRTSGMGNRRRRLQPDEFLAHQISLPPLAEQHRVVSYASEVAARIHEIGARREVQHQVTADMLAAVFLRLVHEAPRRPMREIAPIVRRPIEVDPSAGFAELGIRSFGKGTFHKPTISGLEIGTKRIFRIEPGDLVFSNVFAWEGAIAVAKADDANRVGSHRYITCVPRPDVATAEFLSYFFLTNEGLRFIRAASPGGAGRNRTLGLAALETIAVPVPPIQDQRRFDALRAKVETAHALHNVRATDLTRLDSVLLAEAFRT